MTTPIKNLDMLKTAADQLPTSYVDEHGDTYVQAESFYAECPDCGGEYEFFPVVAAFVCTSPEDCGNQGLAPADVVTEHNEVAITDAQRTLMIVRYDIHFED